ncbi:RNA-directed RNA polymerase L, partial [Bienertia sinuspersici]
GFNGFNKTYRPQKKIWGPNPSNKVNWTCSFCNKVCKGGVFRGFRNVTKCPTCPEHVREEVKLDPESWNTKGNGSGLIQSKKRSRVKGPWDMYVTTTPR